MRDEVMQFLSYVILWLPILLLIGQVGCVWAGWALLSACAKYVRRRA